MNLEIWMPAMFLLGILAMGLCFSLHGSLRRKYELR